MRIHCTSAFDADPDRKVRNAVREGRTQSTSTRYGTFLSPEVGHPSGPISRLQVADTRSYDRDLRMKRSPRRSRNRNPSSDCNTSTLGGSPWQIRATASGEQTQARCPLAAKSIPPITAPEDRSGRPYGRTVPVLLLIDEGPLDDLHLTTAAEILKRITKEPP